MYFVGAGFGPKYGCVEGLLETVFSNLCDCWGNGHREYDECLDFDSHGYLLSLCLGVVVVSVSLCLQEQYRSLDDKVAKKLVFRPFSSAVG